MITTSGKPLKYKPGDHPNSRKNLKSGYHGQNTNPQGYSLASSLKARLARNPSTREEIVTSTIQGALLREPTPFKELWDRVDGKLSGDSVAINFNEIKILIVEASPPEISQIPTVVVEQVEK